MKKKTKKLLGQLIFLSCPFLLKGVINMIARPLIRKINDMMTETDDIDLEVYGEIREDVESDEEYEVEEPEVEPEEEPEEDIVENDEYKKCTEKKEETIDIREKERLEEVAEGLSDAEAAIMVRKISTKVLMNEIEARLVEWHKLRTEIVTTALSLRF